MRARKIAIGLLAAAVLLVPTAAHAAPASEDGNYTCSTRWNNVKVRMSSVGDVDGVVAGRYFSKDASDWLYETHVFGGHSYTGYWSANAWVELNLTGTYAYC